MKTIATIALLTITLFACNREKTYCCTCQQQNGGSFEVRYTDKEKDHAIAKCDEMEQDSNGKTTACDLRTCECESHDGSATQSTSSH